MEISGLWVDQLGYLCHEEHHPQMDNEQWWLMRGVKLLWIRNGLREKKLRIFPCARNVVSGFACKYKTLTVLTHPFGAYFCTFLAGSRNMSSSSASVFKEKQANSTERQATTGKANFYCCYLAHLPSQQDQVLAHLGCPVHQGPSSVNHRTLYWGPPSAGLVLH